MGEKQTPYAQHQRRSGSYQIEDEVLQTAYTIGMFTKEFCPYSYFLKLTGF